MKKALDTLLSNRKLAIIIPLVTATFMYVLFLIFGDMDKLGEYIIQTPVICFIAFWGVFLVAYTHTKHTDFLPSFLLTPLIACGFYAISACINFLRDLREGFSLWVCMGMVIWSSIALAYDKIIKNSKTDISINEDVPRELSKPQKIATFTLIIFGLFVLLFYIASVLMQNDIIPSIEFSQQAQSILAFLVFLPLFISMYFFGESCKTKSGHYQTTYKYLHTFSILFIIIGLVQIILSFLGVYN